MRATFIVFLLLLLVLFVVSCGSEVTGGVVRDSEITAPLLEVPEEELDSVEDIDVEEDSVIREELPVRDRSAGEVHTVNLIKNGFEVATVTIKAGDTVVWQNVRDEGFTKALIVGTQRCTGVRSSIYLPGEYYGYKFKEPGVCTIVDGIFTTQAMKVIVE